MCIHIYLYNICFNTPFDLLQKLPLPMILFLPGAFDEVDSTSPYLKGNSFSYSQGIHNSIIVK